MAKYTKEMEYKELAKRGECFCATSNCGGLGIVVSNDGCGVLWRRYCMDKSHTAQRWQEIKYTFPRNEDQEARPYITIYGTRYYLDNFMRCA